MESIEDLHYLIKEISDTLVNTNHVVIIFGIAFMILAIVWMLRTTKAK